MGVERKQAQQSAKEPIMFKNRKPTFDSYEDILEQIDAELRAAGQHPDDE